ncbi:MAG: arginyltransferase [Rhodospirillales bacterium]|nr:arginyltransferase [Rhodospirillales bacterium]
MPSDPDIQTTGSLPTQLFTSPPSPCPYLDGKIERKLIAELSGPNPDRLYAALSLAGFRRSHGIVYLPACPDCNACIPVRVDTENYKPSRSMTRIMRKNSGTRATEFPARATEEQFALFSHYVGTRHNDGNMAEMTWRDFQFLIEETTVTTGVVEFRDTDNRLIGACLIDYLETGLSAVYSFFDPSEDRSSLGSYMILWIIERAREMGLPYVYLGYWIEGSRKMAYKARFKPLEGLVEGRWINVSP